MRLRLLWHLLAPFVALAAVFGVIEQWAKPAAPPVASTTVSRAAVAAQSDQPVAPVVVAVETDAPVALQPLDVTLSPGKPANPPAIMDAPAQAMASFPAWQSPFAWPDDDPPGATAIPDAPVTAPALPPTSSGQSGAAQPATPAAATREPATPAPAQPRSQPTPDAVRWQQFGSAAINDGKSLNAVAGATGGEFWAAGDGGEVWHFAAGAAYWTRVPLAQGVTYRDNLNSIYPVPGVPGEAWAVGNAAGILHCTAKVCSQAMPAGVTGELDSIWMVSPTEGWAVGAHGAILHYAGGAWRNVGSRPELAVQLHAVQMLSAGEGYAVGEKGTILHYRGGNWTPVETRAKGALIALWFTSPMEGWIVGGNNGGPAITYHYLNGEVLPETTAPETANTRLWYVYMFPDGTGWAVANGGYVIRRTATGEWRLAYTAPGGSSVFGIWLDSPDSGWAVAGDGTADHLVRVHF